MQIQGIIIIYFNYSPQAEVIELTSCLVPSRCCDLVFTNIKDCLLLECAFNLIGSCISTWLIVIIWRRRLQHDHRRASLNALRDDVYGGSILHFNKGRVLFQNYRLTGYDIINSTFKLIHSLSQCQEFCHQFYH